MNLIDEHSLDGLGWARFSADRVHRYRLGRALTEPGRVWITNRGHSTASGVIFRVTFVMLNPSTADAFKVDPTIHRCVKFAQLWGADVLQVANLFSFRSPNPKDLKTAANRGDDPQNDDQILFACRGANKVVASWGAGGELYGRADNVSAILRSAGVALHHLGLSQEGFPKHPLARGKHFIPYDKVLEVF